MSEVQQMLPSHSQPLRAREIMAVVRDYYQLDRGELVGPGRSRRVSWPRQMAMVLMSKRTNMSTTQIAGAVGRHDHTTVLHARKVVAARCAGAPHLKADLEELGRRLTLLRGDGEFIRHSHAHGKPFSTVRKRACGNA